MINSGRSPLPSKFFSAALLIFGMLFFTPVDAAAQLSVSPDAIYRYDCYTISSYPNATLDVKYYYNYQGPYEILGWPTTDGNGQAYICTDELTAFGTYTFSGVRVSGVGNYVDVSASVYVVEPYTYSVSYSPNYGFAGASSYTLSMDASGWIDMLVMINNNGIWIPNTIWLDNYGQWSWTSTHTDVVGTYHIGYVKAHGAPDDYWRPPAASADFTMYPPKPTSFSMSPPSVTAGQDSYTMTVGNGANVTLDLTFSHNGLPEVTVYNWQTLSPVSSGSPNGTITVPVGVCNWPGSYFYPKLRNSAANPSVAASWYNTTSSDARTITINSPPPTISSVSPSSGTRQSSTANYTVTFAGTNLCATDPNTGNGLTITANGGWSGLTFDNINFPYSGNGTGGTANFSVANNAGLGVVPITLAANGGSTDFSFIINTNGAGVPAITGVSPNNGARGTSVPVTLTGTNLSGATLLTTTAGLSFSNVTSSATSVSATLTIASSATLGAGTIYLGTPLGGTSFSFTVNTSGVAGPQITGISPNSGVIGTSVPVTISGNSLSGSTLSTTWSGLTFSNVNATATSITATFTISSSAAAGVPPIKVTTSGGFVTTSLFSITSSSSITLYWKKDYIQDDSGQVVATATPRPSDTTAPGAATGLGHSGLTSTSVTLVWTPPSDSDLAGYRIYRQRNNEASLPLAVVGPLATSFTDSALQAGTQYTYTL